MTILHANLAAYRQEGRWRGVLLRGASGAGKSDLTLRLLSRGWRLVADDRVIVWTSGGRLWGRAPEAILGLLEVRTVGVVCAPPLPFVEITMVMDCSPAAELERIPAQETIALFGVALPFCQIDATASSAPEKAIFSCGASCL